MKNYAAIGTCHSCNQGRLIIARDDSSGELFVICEECEAEWAHPDQVRCLEASAVESRARCTLLEREEVEGQHPWSVYLW